MTLIIFQLRASWKSWVWWCMCLYLSTVPQHGVWWFGQLLSTNDFENELLLGVSWKRVITEWIKWAWGEWKTTEQELWFMSPLNLKIQSHLFCLVQFQYIYMSNVLHTPMSGTDNIMWHVWLQLHLYLHLLVSTHFFMLSIRITS